MNVVAAVCTQTELPHVLHSKRSALKTELPHCRCHCCCRWHCCRRRRRRPSAAAAAAAAAAVAAARRTISAGVLCVATIPSAISRCYRHHCSCASIARASIARANKVLSYPTSLPLGVNNERRWPASSWQFEGASYLFCSFLKFKRLVSGWLSHGRATSELRLRKQNPTRLPDWCSPAGRRGDGI